MENILLRKSHVLALFDGNCAAVARCFEPPISRVAVRNWPAYVPELRARKLLDRYPQLREDVVDAATGLSLREMRERLSEPTSTAGVSP